MQENRNIPIITTNIDVYDNDIKFIYIMQYQINAVRF